MSDERRIASENVDNNDEVLQWVTFKLDSETYGINVMQVQEVLRLYRNRSCAWCAKLCTWYH